MKYVSGPNVVLFLGLLCLFVFCSGNSGHLDAVEKKRKKVKSRKNGEQQETSKGNKERIN